MEGKVGAVEKLLLLKADKNIRGGCWRSAPLHWACIKGNEEIIRLLLEKGANPDVKDDAGKLPFQFIKNDELRAKLMGCAANIHVKSAAELKKECNEEKAKLDKEHNEEKARLPKRFTKQAAIDIARRAAAEKAETSAPLAAVEVAGEETAISVLRRRNSI